MEQDNVGSDLRGVSPIEHAELRYLHERLGETVVRNKDGVPLLLHHGTFFKFDKFEVTSDVGFHFGSDASAFARRRQAPLPKAKDVTWRIISACLKVTKPIFLEADPQTWSSGQLKRALEVSGYGEIARDIDVNDVTWFREHEAMVSEEKRKLLQRLVSTNQDWANRVLSRNKGENQSDWDVLDAAAQKKFSQQFNDLALRLGTYNRALLKPFIERGYDGICYPNFFEARQKRSLSWCVFSDAQVLKIGENLGRELLAPGHAFAEAGISPPKPREVPPPLAAADERSPQNYGPTALNDRQIAFALRRLCKDAGLDFFYSDVLDGAGFTSSDFILRAQGALFSISLNLWSADIVQLVEGAPSGTRIGQPIEWQIRESAESFAKRLLEAVQPAADLTCEPGQMPPANLQALRARGPIVASSSGKLLRFWGETGFTRSPVSTKVCRDAFGGKIRLPAYPCHAIASSKPLIVKCFFSRDIAEALGLSPSSIPSPFDWRKAALDQGYDAIAELPSKAAPHGRWVALDPSIVIKLPANTVADAIAAPAEWGLEVGLSPWEAARRAPRRRLAGPVPVSA